MEPSDLNTHLPPRKRLLAGFRTAAAASSPSSDASEQSPPPPPSPSPLVLPDDLAARLRGMMGPPTATPPPSPEEIIRAARRAASAAADAAAAARAAAEDKAAVAAKARAAARAAMELLDSLSVSRSRNGIQLKAKSKKKHVQVKLLYRPPGHRSPGPETVGDDDDDDDDDPPRPHRRRRESDEEVARKLHRVMNSSPRISFTGPKRPRGLVDAGEDGCPTDGGGDACNGSSTHTLTEVGGSVDGCSVGKSGERTVHFTKIRAPDDDGEESSWNSSKSRHIADNGAGIGSPSAGRKVKIKRKQLFLNHHDSKDREEQKETEPSLHSIGYSESKSNGAEKRQSFADARAQPGVDPVPMKLSSVWKFKKFKPSSHCSSDSKMLHNVCSSSSAAAEASAASVKAD